MSKTTEVLKLAEESLGNLIVWMDANKLVVLPKERKSLAAIREALAEPVNQEPVVYYAYATIKEYEELAGFSVSEAFRVGWNMARTTNSMLGINAAPVQPVKQKPVGEVDLHKELGQLRWMGGDEGWDNAIHAVRKRLEELYAAPVSAKLEWVDLTDDEIDLIEQQVYCRTTQKGRPLGVYAVELVRAVIAAFKEKNK